MNAKDKIYEIAKKQQGYFTSKQAITAGYRITNHPYHVKCGNWIREERGIYRLAQFPESIEGQLVIWSLWSRDRRENIQGVYSYETSLSIYDISDVMPAKLHMTVPNNFRRSVTPSILILHKADLSDDDVVQRQGYQVTTPLRTLMDIIAEGSLEENIIQQAVDQFRAKGMLLKKEVYQIIEAYPKSAHYFININ